VAPIAASLPAKTMSQAWGLAGGGDGVLLDLDLAGSREGEENGGRGRPKEEEANDLGEMSE